MGDHTSVKTKKPKPIKHVPETPGSQKWLDSPITKCGFCFRPGRWTGYYCDEHAYMEEVNRGYIGDDE